MTSSMVTEVCRGDSEWTPVLPECGDSHLCNICGDNNFPLRCWREDTALLVAGQVGMEWEYRGVGDVP